MLAVRDAFLNRTNWVGSNRLLGHWAVNSAAPCMELFFCSRGSTLKGTRGDAQPSTFYHNHRNRMGGNRSRWVCSFWGSNRPARIQLSLGQFDLGDRLAEAGRPSTRSTVPSESHRAATWLTSLPYSGFLDSGFLAGSGAAGPGLLRSGCANSDLG